METPISQPTLTDSVPSGDDFNPAPQPEPAYAAPEAVLVIPRVVFNYVVIGIVFFALGAVVGGAGVGALFNANSAENKALIDTAVNQAVEAAGTGTRTGLQPGEKYDVTATDLDPVRGAPDAPITIVEFSDFKCPYCGRFVRETLEPLMADFDGKIKIVYRDYPILGQASVLGALAGACANDQGKFWQFHDLMFANQADLTREAFLQYAADLEMDVETFTTCFDEQQHMTEIQADYVYAQNLGVTGTPAFFVNGRFVSGAQPYQVFADTINQELAALAEASEAGTS